MPATGMKHWLYYGRLVQALAARDIASRFANASLGLAWLLIRPTIFMVVFSIVRGALRLPTDGLPYPLSSYTAISVWFLFVGTLQGVTPSIQTNAGILKKMAVPRILFPISATIVAMIEYLVTFLPLAALFIFYGWPVTWTFIYIPMLMMIVVLLGLGLGLLLSSFAVFRDDVLLALPHIIMLWFFLTPVIYPATRLPENFRWLYQVNPMTGPVEAFRDVMLRGTPPDWWSLLPAVITIGVLWVVAIPVYNFMSRYFADAL